jgi:hypothetical protein
MARLPALDSSEGQRLDAWLKGPVYYDSDVRLRATLEPDSSTFALIAAGEERPAILGCWRRTGTAGSLLPQEAVPA